jgi:hypothetical protein
LGKTQEKNHPARWESNESRGGKLFWRKTTPPVGKVMNRVEEIYLGEKPPPRWESNESRGGKII